MKKINLVFTIIALSLAFLNCTKKVKDATTKTETVEVKPAPVVVPEVIVSNKKDRKSVV